MFYGTTGRTVGGDEAAGEAVEVVLLGAGAADGWPNAFCRCASCGAQRVDRRFRTPTCALVDRRLLLDCGPLVGQQAQAAGVDLADVATVLLTHAHADHLDPRFLLSRGWVSDEPLTIAGPRAALDVCRPWLDPVGSPVELVELTAGDERTVGAYRVRALSAVHDAFGPCLLYAVRGDAALLYATDTGPWVDAAADHLRGDRFDLVLMEETFGTADLSPHHLHLASFGAEVAALRALGCLEDATQIAAIHLSHTNPAEPELRDRLAAFGAIPGEDGSRWTLDLSRPCPRTRGP